MGALNKEGRRALSAVVIACNESRRIEACLESLRFADEIVVVDSGSTDGTAEAARRHTDRVFNVPWRGFGPQKQAAVDLASNDFILSVDCDERVTPELAGEIRDLLAAGGLLPGYSVPRRTFIGDREIRHGGWYPDRTVRLFDRTRARYSADPVHERVVVPGEVGRLSHHLLHFSFEGFADILVKMNRYTDLSARSMFEAGRRCGLSDLAVRPLLAFAKAYFFRAGFLDGVEGLEVAAAGAMHVFAKYVKLRELGRSADGGGKR
jgi:glycosyltransferase involved in cell wall biosynthesis